MDWAELLHFWFGDLENGFADAEHRQRWFESSASFDETCTTQFGHWLQAATTGALADWLAAPRSCLAFIVLCDQLPRNIYRGKAEAFAWDHLALKAAREAVTRGHDRELVWDERAFMYMPFEHSENLLDQHTAVGLFSHLRDESPKANKALTGNNLRFAQQHRDIIMKFGRFPHRNAVLGRISSPTEQAFTQAGDGFGQAKIE